MIEVDYVSRTRDLREVTMISGIQIVKLARDIVYKHRIKELEEDKGVYLERGLRQYRLENVRGSIRIEGLVFPPTDENSSFNERLGDVRVLIPVVITPAGVIESEGRRISPHDRRIAILATDLSEPVKISPTLFWTNAAKVRVVG